jgi:putative endonuclease
MAKNVTYQKRIGDEGEDFARQYLRARGYQILERNYHSRYGEVDLVAEHDRCIVFVEVKTRTSDRFGLPEESVTPEKLEKINDTGLLWLQDHPEAPDDWRVDVIAIIMDKNQNVVDIQHFVDIN